MNLLNEVKKFSIIINRIPFYNVIKSRGNRIDFNKALLLKSKINIYGTGNKVYIENGTVLYKCAINILGNNNVVHIGRDNVLKYVHFNIEDSDNNIVLGNNIHLCGATNIACIEGTSVIMGDNCLGSANIEIRSGDSHSIFNIQNERINCSRDVTIGNHVWLGQGVYILKGSRIPDNCVVGASSVVTKPFLDNNCIIVGNPAKVVKREIIWDAKRI